MKKQTRNIKNRHGAPKLVFVRAENEEEIRAWGNAETRRTPDLCDDVAKIIQEKNETPISSHGEETLINFPKMEVSKWVYERGVTCTICLREMGTVATLVAHFEAEHKIFVQSNPTVIALKNGEEGEQVVALEVKKAIELQEKCEIESIAIESQTVQITENVLKQFYREADRRWVCPEKGCKANFWQWDNCVQHLKLCHPESQILKKMQKPNPQPEQVQKQPQMDTFSLSSLSEILKNPTRVTRITPKSSNFGPAISSPIVAITSSLEEEKTSQIQNILCPLSKCRETFLSIVDVNLHLKFHHKTGLSLNESGPIGGTENVPTDRNSKPLSNTGIEICTKENSSSSLNCDARQGSPPPHLDRNKRMPQVPWVSSGFPCLKCGFIFKQRRFLSGHTRKISNCHLKRNPLLTLTFAEYRIENGKNYQCPTCLIRIFQRDGFVRHIFRVHPNSELASKIGSTEVKSFHKYEQKKQRCISCNKVYKNAISLQEHLRRAHKIETPIKSITKNTKYAVKEDESFIQNARHMGGESTFAVDITDNAEPLNVVADLSPEIVDANNASTDCPIQLQNEGADKDLVLICIDKENLRSFDVEDNAEGATENGRVEGVSETVSSKNENFLSPENIILPNRDLSTFPVAESKNAGISSARKEKEDEPSNGDIGVHLNVGDNPYSTDGSDVELPPPGFEEEEDVSQTTSRLLMKKKPFKRIGNKRAVTDYSFVKIFKQGQGNQFQCPLCPKVLMGNFTFCRHLLVCHPKADLTNQVSAKRIQGLIGMERVKYKCHICYSVLACALYLSRHFKRAHKRFIPVDEITDKPSLLAPEESAEFETDKSNSEQQEGPRLPLYAESSKSQQESKSLSNSTKMTKESDVLLSNFYDEEKILKPVSSCRIRKRSASISYREDSPIDEKKGTRKRRRMRKTPNDHFASSKISKKRLGKEKALISHIGCHKKSEEISDDDANLLEPEHESRIGNFCPICEEILPRKKSLSRHIGWHKRRGEIIEDQEQAEPENENLINVGGVENCCPICEEILPPERNLHLHIFWHKRNTESGQDCEEKSKEYDNANKETDK